MSDATTIGGGAAAVRARGGRARVRGGLTILCFAVISAVAVMAALGSAIAPEDAGAQDLALGATAPSGAHWFGTDELGRDVLSRVIVGAQAAFVGPLVVALGSMLIGNVLGLIAGYRGGRTDSLIMRWVDLMFALPGLLVAIVLIGAIDGGYWMAVLVLMLLSAPVDTRVIRGAVLEQMPRPYIEAARTLGVPGRRIMLLHLWPNVSAIAVANTCLMFAVSLVALSGLSFLGFGGAPGDPEWGLMLAENRTQLFTNPAAAIAPGAMIIVTATCMNLIGDWLFERISSRGATR
jgi:peptide/nickel transport system permease protein